MGDLLRHVSRDFDRVIFEAPRNHGIPKNDIAMLASACVHSFAETFGTAGIEALLRTRTLSKYCSIDEQALKDL